MRILFNRCVLAISTLLFSLVPHSESSELAINHSKENPTGKLRLNNTNKNYTYLYWENGLPQQKISRRPKSWANPNMALNPDLIFQTGYYNLRFDTNDLHFSGYEESIGSHYIKSLTEDVAFTSSHQATLILKVKVNEQGVLNEYKAVSAIVETDDQLNVRLIESGRFVQRVDHTGLIFVDSSGHILSDHGYFEITSWPEHFVLTLDFSHTKLPIYSVTMKVVS